MVQTVLSRPSPLSFPLSLPHSVIVRFPYKNLILLISRYFLQIFDSERSGAAPHGPSLCRLCCGPHSHLVVLRPNSEPWYPHCLCQFACWPWLHVCFTLFFHLSILMSSPKAHNIILALPSLLLVIPNDVHVRYFACFCITSGTYTTIGLTIAWCAYFLYFIQHDASH